MSETVRELQVAAEIAAHCQRVADAHEAFDPSDVAGAQCGLLGYRAQLGWVLPPDPSRLLRLHAAVVDAELLQLLVTQRDLA